MEESGVMMSGSECSTLIFLEGSCASAGVLTPIAATPGGVEGDGGKKSVCDPDYATPRPKSVGFYNHPVKRRLDFGGDEQLLLLEGEAGGMEGGNKIGGWEEVHCSTSTTAAAVNQPEGVAVGGLGGKEEEVEERHQRHPHRKRKKRKRSSRKEATTSGAGDAMNLLNEQGGEGKTCSSDNSILVGEGGEKENSVGAPAAVPPRRIAQLVVWTKNLTTSSAAPAQGGSCSGGGEQSLASCVGGGKGKGKEEETSKAGGGRKRAAREGEEKKKQEGGEEGRALEGGGKEGDLFFVQYPARPYADQGKGKGKPFRRLNSYNDPIVIKKTPPPPPPSEKRRRGGGGAEGGGKRKRGGGGHNHLPNKKEAGISSAFQETSSVVIEASQGVQIGGGEVVYEAYLHQQDFKIDQLFQFPQASSYFGVTEVTSAGQVISLAPQQLPPPDATYPEGGSTREAGTEEEGSSVPPVILLSVPPPQPTSRVSMEVAPPTTTSGGDPTVFELPDRFTVTTDGSSMNAMANEFDLLIQNVVHEEVLLANDSHHLGMNVGGGEGGREEEQQQQLYQDERMAMMRKRMRLSCGGGGEEEMVMMEETGGGGGDDNCSGGEGDPLRGGVDEPGKPRCTYTELIEKALTESGGLTVSEIYNWISERYPYYRQDDDRWKNSVRHNLSINPYFKKGEKARSGAGHLWTISEESKGLRPSMVSCWGENLERRKSPCDPGDLLLSMDNDTDRAVANILGMYRSKVAAAASEQKEEESLKEPAANPLSTPDRHQPPPENSSSTCQAPAAAAEGDQLSANGSTATITLNQLNSGQFTVDLSGITIPPEGGTINFDELVSNGRLIYIETASGGAVDPDANKENEQLSTNADRILAELTGGGGADVNSIATTTTTSGGAYYSSTAATAGVDQGVGFSLDLGGGGFGGEKGGYLGGNDHITTTTSGGGEELRMVSPADVIAPTVSSHHPHHRQDFSSLDQCLLHPMLPSTSISSTYDHILSSNCCPTTTSAAFYESKELGIPYTFQTTAATSEEEIPSLSSPPPYLHHSDLLQ